MASDQCGDPGGVFVEPSEPPHGVFWKRLPYYGLLNVCGVPASPYGVKSNRAATLGLPLP